MKQFGLKRAFLIVAVVTCGVFGSLDWSQNDGLSFRLTSAASPGRSPLDACELAPALLAGRHVEQFVEERQ